jgi:hypothetical protein
MSRDPYVRERSTSPFTEAGLEANSLPSPIPLSDTHAAAVVWAPCAGHVMGALFNSVDPLWDRSILKLGASDALADFLRCFPKIHGARFVSLRVWIILEHAMTHKLHFGSATPAREALQTKALIADINRIVQILDSDIAAEEKQARVFDRSQAEYPMLARTMAARRDNLLNTISALEQRLAKLDQDERVPELV